MLITSKWPPVLVDQIDRWARIEGSSRFEAMCCFVELAKGNRVNSADSVVRSPRATADPLVKLPDDGALVEFASAVDALSTAIEF